MTIEEVFESFIQQHYGENTDWYVKKMGEWALSHTDIMEKLATLFGGETTATIVATAAIVWANAYRRGLPSDLEDIIPKEYLR
ncbi:MAG: hypothetical protein HY459_02050 [Parcubacteria group bacterium]|nr:hypothetical protein [Parcubacteria group bacterium]